MLKVIIIFHEGMKANIVSDGMMSEYFDVTNGTKTGCVMAPVLFALFFSVMLKYAFADRERVASSFSFEQLVVSSIISASKPIPTFVRNLFVICCFLVSLLL